MNCFSREAEMLPPVMGWLQRDGLMVKSEVVVPWGVCDLVGCSLDSDHVAVRLSQQQIRSLGPLPRVQLLLAIPDESEPRGVTAGCLAGKFDGYFGAGFTAANLEQLIRSKFVVSTATGSLKKVNGWHPLHSRIVAVELKLRRISEAIAQASLNFGFAQESYVGMPIDVARRALTGARVVDFEKSGVGLVGVRRDGIDVLLPSVTKRDRISADVQAWLSEGFLRLF